MSSSAGSERLVDITEEILAQHHEQRRMFALLDEIDPNDPAKLSAIWRRLAVFLEVHAAAEERYFYPELLRRGAGSPGGDDPVEETVDAIKDHNEIRAAIADAARHEPGSDGWWRAVRAAREANSDHMAEEERDDLADFRRSADLETRHRIAVDFLVYEALHADGIDARDQDPEEYVAEHR
jgi:hypothetical protein